MLASEPSTSSIDRDRREGLNPDTGREDGRVRSDDPALRGEMTLT